MAGRAWPIPKGPCFPGQVRIVVWHSPLAGQQPERHLRKKATQIGFRWLKVHILQFMKQQENLVEFWQISTSAQSLFQPISSMPNPLFTRATMPPAPNSAEEGCAAALPAWMHFYKILPIFVAFCGSRWFILQSTQNNSKWLTLDRSWTAIITGPSGTIAAWQIGWQNRVIISNGRQILGNTNRQRVTSDQQTESQSWVFDRSNIQLLRILRPKFIHTFNLPQKKFLSQQFLKNSILSGLVFSCP